MAAPTKVTLYCTRCGFTARRALANEPGSRGTHETSSETALCPQGHGVLSRREPSESDLMPPFGTKRGGEPNERTRDR